MGGTYEEQNRGGNDVIQMPSAKTNAHSRNNTKTAGPGQLKKHGIQARDNGNRDDISNRPT